MIILVLQGLVKTRHTENKLGEVIVLLDQTKTIRLPKCNESQPRKTGLLATVILLAALKTIVYEKGYLRQGLHGLWPYRCSMMSTLRINKKVHQHFLTLNLVLKIYY